MPVRASQPLPGAVAVNRPALPLFWSVARQALAFSATPGTELARREPRLSQTRAKHVN